MFSRTLACRFTPTRLRRSRKPKLSSFDKTKLFLLSRTAVSQPVLVALFDVSSKTVVFSNFLRTQGKPKKTAVLGWALYRRRSRLRRDQTSSTFSSAFALIVDILGNPSTATPLVKRFLPEHHNRLEKKSLTRTFYVYCLNAGKTRVQFSLNKTSQTSAISWLPC